MNININQTLENWIKELEGTELPTYEKLPDIDLYMEQMIRYLDRVTNVLRQNSEDDQITSSMINNYVKGKIVTAPKSKRYTKEQISQLIEIIYLKQVMSLPEIKQIISTEYKVEPKEAYEKYLSLRKDATKKAISDTKAKVSECDVNNKEELTSVALELAAKANAYALMSKKILYLLNILNYVDETNEGSVEQVKEDI